MNIYETIKEQVPMRKVLNYYGITPNANGKILCFYHNDKNNPSCHINKKDSQHKGDWFYCFTCGATGDIFDLVQKIENCSKSESLKIIEKNFGDCIDVNYNSVMTTKTNACEINQSEFIKNAAQNIDKTTYNRGISLETLKHFNVGYCPDWHNSPNHPSSPRLIIPTSEWSYFARDTRKNQSYEEKKYSKQKVGKVRPLIAIRNSSEPFFIVEGEIDALSIYDAGGNAIGIGGTSGINKLPLWLRENNIKSTLILALDNDDAGKNTTKKLKEILDKEKIIYIENDLYGDYKDANEALNKDKTAFEFAIKNAIFNATHINTKSYVPAYIDKKGKTVRILRPKLASEFRKHENYFCLISEGSKPIKYIYENGYYKLISDNEFKGKIKKYITQYDENLLSMADVEEVFRILITDEVYISVDDINADENIINFQNGLLYLDTMELKPHTPKVYSTIQLPCEWNSTEKNTPVFDKFMNDLSNGNEDVKKLILQYAGLCISNVFGYRIKSAMFLFGKGDSGKSQIQALLQRLIGTNNIS